MFEGKQVKVLLSNAGSGKTSTLINYIEKELETRRPEEIAFVTFTKKGAEEGLRRVCDKFRLTPDDLPYFRTLHSLTFHALNLDVKQMFSALNQKEFNKEYGYYVNRVEVNKGRAHPTKDSLYLDYYDLERSNALTSKQIAESDIDLGYYRSLVQKYEEYKADKCLVDFFDCLIKYVQEGDSLPCKIVMLDEAQDITALQWRVIEKAFQYAEKVYIAGDDKQCQPTGSKVLTKKGYKNIEDITEEDSLITFAQEDYAYYGLRQAEYHPEVAHRHYTGKLIDVEINGTVNRFTPSHKMIVKWLNRDTSLYCVYLMRKGKKFRVGQCKIFNSNGTTHFTVRMNGEQAEEGWFLRICKTKKEALVWEQVYSLSYGVPQISWKFWHTQAMQEEVYNFLPCLEEKAEKLLEEVGRNINYPMFNHEKNNAKSGGTCISLCEAINLVPEIMALPVYQGKSRVDKNTLWQTFTTREENFSGFVYSMNVPKYHTYVTEGGLTVHNCIYKYAGARPDILISLSKQFPVEHLAKSYRIPLSVYRLANAVTDFIGEKSEQVSEPRLENGEGSITRLSNVDRLTSIIEPVMENYKESSWFILARNKCYLNSAMSSLEDRLIPYWTVDGFFMGGEIMKRITDYEGFRLEGYKSEEKRNQFAKKFGITDFTKPFTSTNLFTEGRKWIYASYIERFGLPLLKEMCKWNPQILVSTIHAVKGAEADNVAVLLDTTKRTKRNVFDDIDEELRILYVGVTRTKKNLYLIDSRDGSGYDTIINCVKNQFGLNF